MSFTEDQIDEIKILNTQQNAAQCLTTYLNVLQPQDEIEASFYLQQLMLVTANALNQNAGKAATMKIIQDIKRAASDFEDVGAIEDTPKFEM